MDNRSNQVIDDLDEAVFIDNEEDFNALILAYYTGEDNVFMFKGRKILKGYVKHLLNHYEKIYIK